MESYRVMTNMEHWQGIGLVPGEVQLSDWSDQWSSLFEEEAARITEACGEVEIRLEHVGGTSIDGARSRPMIDILLGIEHLRDSGALIEPLKQIGYRCHGENGVPGRRHFTRSVDRRCMVNLELFQLDSESWERILTLRDRLRSDANLLGQYVDLKTDLQSRFPDNPGAYQDGKAVFEESVLAGE